MSTLSVENLQHPSSSNANITLDSNGNINLGAGSASLPSITAQGDTNTGIYFPAADNIGFATGGTIRGRWTDNGLCFGTDTAAANALDDYEEGTFDPTVFGGTTAGTTTYNFRNGNYTKIGRSVIFRLRVSISAATGTGSLLIGGLPFASSLQNPCSIGYVNTLALTANNFPIVFVSSLGIEFYQYPIGGGTGTAVPIDGSFDIIIGGVYQAD